MSKHTAGPWRIGMKPGPMIYGPHGEQVADLRAAMVPTAEGNADARLIAAAPELLAALQAFAALYSGDSYTPDEWNAAVRAARAAIRKATGGGDA